MGVGGAMVASMAAVAAAWVALPVVSMARRGTIDQRTVEAWQSEGVTAAVSIPAPRTAADDLVRTRV